MTPVLYGLPAMEDTTTRNTVVMFYTCNCVPIFPRYIPSLSLFNHLYCRQCCFLHFMSYFDDYWLHQWERAQYSLLNVRGKTYALQMLCFQKVFNRYIVYQYRSGLFVTFSLIFYLANCKHKNITTIKHETHGTSTKSPGRHQSFAADIPRPLPVSKFGYNVSN